MRSEEAADRGRYSSRWDEDMGNRIVPDGVARYASTAIGQISYASVFRVGQDQQETTLGFLWYSDEQDAAGYVANTEAAPDGFAVGAHWRTGLEKAKARGEIPSAAIATLEDDDDDPFFGVVASDRQVASSVEELRSLSGP